MCPQDSDELVAATGVDGKTGSAVQMGREIDESGSLFAAYELERTRIGTSTIELYRHQLPTEQIDNPTQQRRAQTIGGDTVADVGSGQDRYE